MPLPMPSTRAPASVKFDTAPKPALVAASAKPDVPLANPCANAEGEVVSPEIGY